MDPQEDRDIIVFGLDFGTTFSGVAWAYSKDPDAISTVTSWPSQQSHCSDKDKAPTQISFEGINDAETAAWGYGATVPGKTARWFKLLLLEQKDVPVDVLHSDQYNEAIDMMKKLDKTSIELVACYIKKIWDHTLEVLTRSEGPALLDISEFHIVVTLPAIWPEYAKKKMAKALEKSEILKPRLAGQTTLRFISEPEAAALATITDLAKRPTLQPGHTLIICDAGGGTVDLVTYEVQKIRPFVVKEIVKGDGELCGGVVLDEAFLAFIKKKIGSENWDLIDDAAKQRFLNYEWENGIKPQFSDQEDKGWVLVLPEASQQPSQALVLPGAQQNQHRSIKVTTEDLREVFAPVTKRIAELVRRQGDHLFTKTGRKPSHIFLVGGFGRCHHLFNHVQAVAAEFGASLLQSQGSKPWSAISRGAVIQGLTKLNLTPNLGVTVSSRIARRSYGVKYTTNFIDGEHHEDDKAWYAAEGVHKANDQMRWFLNNGDDVDDLEPVKVNFYNIVASKKEWEHLQHTHLEIYCTEVSPPPRRAKHPAVTLLCSIDWVGIVDYRRLHKWKNPEGNMCRKLQYMVSMSCDLGEVEFSIFWDGLEHKGGSIEVDFETTDD